VKAVYDVTIAYNHLSKSQGKGGKGDKGFLSPPTFLQTISRTRIDEDWEIYVHVDRFELSDLPADGEGLAAWLEERWVVKGKRLEGLRANAERGKRWVGDDDGKVEGKMA
jgi:hypothetical protein